MSKYVITIDDYTRGYANEPINNETFDNIEDAKKELWRFLIYDNNVNEDNELWVTEVTESGDLGDGWYGGKVRNVANIDRCGHYLEMTSACEYDEVYDFGNDYFNTQALSDDDYTLWEESEDDFTIFGEKLIAKYPEYFKKLDNGHVVCEW